MPLSVSVSTFYRVLMCLPCFVISHLIQVYSILLVLLEIKGTSDGNPRVMIILHCYSVMPPLISFCLWISWIHSGYYSIGSSFRLRPTSWPVLAAGVARLKAIYLSCTAYVYHSPGSTFDPFLVACGSIPL